MRFATTLLGLLIGTAGPVAAQHAAPPGPYQGQRVVRVNCPDDATFRQAMDIATTVWNCTPSPTNLDLQVTPDQLQQLVALGLTPQVLVQDVQALLDQEQAAIRDARMQRDEAWFTTFRTLTELHARLDHYAATFPTLAETFIAGQTLEGRPIKGVRLSAPDQPGNPRSSRPAVLYNACQHAREWATPMTVMWIADRLVEGYGVDARLTNILDHCEVIVMPVVNADGYEYSWLPNNRLWRKNRRENGNGTFGVDTNRNWGHEWGGEGASTNPGSDTYRGPSAFSEPETQVMRDFVNANPRLKAAIDVHSYSQLILSPWGYTIGLPQDRPIFAMIDDAIADAIESVDARRYDAGPLYTTIYPASGGAVDWYYGGAGILGYSIEVRDTGGYGFVMPPEEIIPNARENFEGCIALAEFVMRPLILAPVGVYPDALPADAPTPVEVAVRASAQQLAGGPTLHVRIDGGAWTEQPMSVVQSSTYGAALPAAACGQLVEYYFSALSSGGQTLTYPADGALLDATGVGSAVVFNDTMETDLGWTVGASGDNATLGIWGHMDPEPTLAQPGDDFTPAPGVLCWVTDGRAGTGVGSFDVDGGTTTLTSPRFSALPASTTLVNGTRLSYARWFSNNQGSSPNQDSMPVYISNDDGATWVLLEDVLENAGQWVVRSYEVSEFVTPTNRMRLRFVARDLGAGSVVEAAVDDVRVEVLGCRPNLDYNNDGSEDQGDLACLIQAIAGDTSCTTLDPDFNQDGSADQADIAALIIALAGG